jgi:chemotaxis protein MotC
MMRKFRNSLLVGAICVSALLPISQGQAQNLDSSAPLYTLVRSLQYVQDTVVSGDFSAMEMQRFLLEQVDRKLREAQPEDFDDPRNVDAALIYAMSGGNPKTLDLVVAQDKYGYFDEEITSIMRAYLNGLIPTTKKPIEEIVDDYLNTAIGPYVALIAANVKAAAKDIKSVELFDLARLVAPGSLIEEAALRRSILISINHGEFDQALSLAHIYARRFNKSPYNVQFSQLIIEMIVQNLDNIDEILVDEVIAYLPVKQQKAIYLRIARTGVVNGNDVMAIKAREKAHLFEGERNVYYNMMADLYASINEMPKGETKKLLEDITNIKRRSLSPIDRPLHDAAMLLAEQILSLPDEKSLTQVMESNMERKLQEAAELKSVNLKELIETGVPDEGRDEIELPGDEEFAEYMQGRSTTLEGVDAMLALESKDEDS